MTVAAMTLALAALAAGDPLPDAWPIAIAGPGGALTGQRVVRTWSITAASGRKVHALAMIVHEPKSRLTWNTYLRSDAPIDRAAVEREELPPFRLATDGTSLTGFRIMSGRLHVRRSEERVDSLEAAVAPAIETISRDLQKGWPATPDPIPPQFVEINLHGPLDTEWLRAGLPIGGVDNPFIVAISGVTLEHGLWRLDLRNGAGENATLFLTPDLQLADGSAAARRRVKE